LKIAGKVGSRFSFLRCEGEFMASDLKIGSEEWGIGSRERFSSVLVYTVHDGYLIHYPEQLLTTIRTFIYSGMHSGSNN